MFNRNRSVGLTNIEVILVSGPSDTSLLQRVDAIRKAARQTGLQVDLAVCSGAILPVLEGTRFISVPPGCGSASALLRSAEGSKARHLLFVPGIQHLDPPLLNTLVDASKEFDWVFSSRGNLPSLGSFAQRFSGLPGALDLGAPSIVRRERFVPIAAGLSADDPFIAVRLARCAYSSECSIGVLPVGCAKPGFLEVLGLDGSILNALLKKRIQGLSVGSAMVAVGILLKQVPLLGLPFFGLGALYFGFFWGKGE